MRNTILRAIKFFLGWPLSFLALFFLWKFFTPQLSNIQQLVAHANFFLLLLSLFTFQLYFLFRVVLWQAILKAKGHTLALKDTAWYWSVAEINRYIPGNIWSIVGRGTAFGKLGIKQSTLYIAWGQESLLIVIGSTLVGLFASSFVFFSLLPSFPFKTIVFWGGLSIIYVIAIAWVFQKGLACLSFIPQQIKTGTLSFSFAWNQLIVSIISFVFFGLATYLSICALYPLPFEQVTLFVGLFSLSYAIGYVMLITPMGLGVRELVISNGLFLFTSRVAAGLAALFARFILVVCELVFLVIAYIVKHAHGSLYARVKQHVIVNKYAYLLWVSIVAYISYYTTASFYRYTNFFTGRFDLGNMDQTVWNSLHGKIFMLTDPNGTNIMSRLGTHADFILVLLAPFYILWEDPRTLLFIQSAVLGVGALFVYLIAKDIFKKKGFAFVVSTAYLLNPSIGFTNLYDFHPVTLATTFFLGAWYSLLKKNYLLMGMFLLLAGFTKEEAWLVVGLFGIYLALFRKKRVLGFFLSAFSFAFFYLLVWKLIPLARGGQHFALSYYADYGNTPTGVVKNIFLSPLKLFTTIFSKGRITYLFELFLPFGFLSLLAPQFLIFALPDLGINLLSSNTQLQDITYQYSAVITPFLFIATIYAASFIVKKWKHVSLVFIGGFLMLSTLTSAYFYGPLPGTARPNIDMFVRQEKDRDIIQSFLDDIPPSFSVAATNNIGSHLSHRQKIFTIPVGMDQADVVVFLLTDPFAQPSLKAQKVMAEQMKHDKNYIEVFKENDFIVFEKRNLYTQHEPTLQKGNLYPASIEALQHRDFEGGNIAIQKTIHNGPITTVFFSYPSDGLTLYARADYFGNNTTSYPVVIINRGYLTPSEFKEETSYKNISEKFASLGYLAITPDYRNNGTSDTDRSIVGILGYPIDVLNLLDSLHTLSLADAKRVFLWGYSIGGQVTLSTLAAYDQNTSIDATVRAACVWAPVIDQYSAYARFHLLFPGQNVPYQRVAHAFGSFTQNPIPWESVSPQYYFNDITTPLRIVQSLDDSVVPYQWSIEAYDSLKSHQPKTQLDLLQDADHNFTHVWSDIVNEDAAYFHTFLSQ